MTVQRGGFYNSLAFSKLLSYSMYGSFILTCIGASFKQLHYPAANMMLIVGLELMCVYFLLAAFPSNPEVSKTENLLVKWFSLSMSVLTVGLMFKWMHWPGGDFLLIVSFCSLAIYYVLKGFTYKASNGIETLYKTMFFMGFSVVVLSMMFRLQHWPGTDVMMAIGYIALMLIVLIQLRMLLLKGTWLVKINAPIGFASLSLFILIALVRLDASIPRTVVEREFINYQMMDQRMASELKNASVFTSNSNVQTRAQVDKLTIGFVEQLDQIKKEVLRLDVKQAKLIFTKSNNPLMPQKIELRDLVGLEQFSGDEVLFNNRNMIVSSITNYKSALTAVCKKSDNPVLRNLSLDGMITEFELDFPRDSAPDELYFAFSMNISLLNELSALQYEALKNRTFVLSNL
jgi:hypothetical protein